MAPPMDKEGYWGEPTSTLDWCEENYVVTPYIAEFWNTISNVVMIIPALAGAVYSWRIGLEPRFIILNLALFVVGIGSWLFHMTLKYEMQLLDELPMIYGGCFFMYAILHYNRRSGEEGATKCILLFLYGVMITVLYLFHPNPILHELAYAVIVLKLAYDGFVISRKYPQLRFLHMSAIACYAIAFLLWTIDNRWCGNLRTGREQFPMMAPLLQLHAWWHFFSAYGTYLHIIFSTWARLLFLKQDYSLKVMGIHPYLQAKNMH